MAVVDVTTFQNRGRNATNQRPVNDGAYRTVSERERAVNTANNQKTQQLYQERARLQTALNNATYNNDSGGGGRTAVAQEVPAYSGDGGGGSATVQTDDIVDKMRKLLEEQEQKAKDYYKSLYEQQLASNKNAWENNRNQINLDYYKTNRYLNSMYGNEVSGAGLTNRARSYTNWNNNLAENQRNYTNNNASALASYNQGLSNAANTLTQGWYNYILPVYTNRQVNDDNLEFKKYLASLGLM